MLLNIARIGHDPIIAYAAEEVKRCLEKMDPSLDILLLTYPKWRADLCDALWIGMDPAFAGEVPPVKDPELDDAIAIDVTGGLGYITGANPRAVLIAAFRYLRQLGAMWVRPQDGEYLPPCDVSSSKVIVKEVPASRHRGVCIEGAVSAEHVIGMIDWLPRVGMNAYFNQFWVPATFYARWYETQRKDYVLERAVAEGIRDTAIYEIKKRGLLYHATGHGWTCEPFGIEGTGWDADKEYHFSDETREFLALTKGKRQLWNNIPLNTNLCYSNPKVRQIVGNSVADYCEAMPEVDFLHVWLADDRNNHCECENCIKKRPSDWYVLLLNAIDDALIARNIKTKVVFLMYNELYWPPVEENLNHPDRFVLMFAPISRTYTHSLAEAGDYDETKLPEFVYNKTGVAKSVEENMCWLRQWQKVFKGDSFDFDYHYMWDQHLDIAHMSMNRVLFNDMQAMEKMGLNGMVSCQSQRAWIPSGFGMYAMAQGLWDNQARFEDTEKTYFSAAFGPEGAAACDYLEKLSALFMPSYLRREMDVICAEVAESVSKIPAHIAAFKDTILKNMECGCLTPMQRRSWEYLNYHSQYSLLIAEAIKLRAEGKPEEAKKAFEKFDAYINEVHPKCSDVLDLPIMSGTLGQFFL